MSESKTNSKYTDHLYAVILAGGGGTRLWPKSREKTPKQFLKLFGNKTLTEITAERIAKFIPWERIIVSTGNEEYGKIIQKLLPLVPRKNIILEPVRKDTAPAQTLAAFYIYNLDKDAVIINAATDHFINPDKNYKRTMLGAAQVAFEDDMLVAIGIPPSYPHTGLGHIKKGEHIRNANYRHVYKLEKFVEKPPLPVAKRYTESGQYYWNANHYVWKAETLLHEIEKYAPEIYSNLSAFSKYIGTKDEKKMLDKYYNLVPKISIDYAVSEKTKKICMMVADYSWTDIGDWNEVWKNHSKDESGNVVIDGEEQGGDLINIDTSDALIHKNGRTIAIIDVDNIVVVDTKDALLICSKSKAQNVKKIVTLLKESGKIDLL